MQIEYALRGGPPRNFVRYEREQSPTGRFQVDFYEDPSRSERQIWIAEAVAGAIRQKLFEHYMPLRSPVIFSPDEQLLAINHGSWAWGTEPTFVRRDGSRVDDLEDNEYQQLAFQAVNAIGRVPEGAEPAHVYCDVIKCVDENTAEVRVLLDCQPSPTTRWIGPFFFRYNVTTRAFSESQLSDTERTSRPESPQYAFEGLKSSGTGFFIASRYIATNEHVVRGATRIRVKTRAGLLPCAIAIADPEIDIAILELETDRPCNATPLTIIDSDVVRLGETVFTVGFPNPQIQGLNPKVTSGLISALSGFDDDLTAFQITTQLQPGNSGGPLLTQSGDVVGVVSSSLDAIEIAKQYGSIPHNVNYAVKASELVICLKKIAAFSEFSPDRQRSSLSFEDAVSRAAESVVRIVVSGFPETRLERKRFNDVQMRTHMALPRDVWTMLTDYIRGSDAASALRADGERAIFRDHSGTERTLGRRGSARRLSRRTPEHA